LWVNDLLPPSVRLLTKRVTIGRTTLAAKVVDSQSGVDPLSLVIAYNNILLGAAAYDPVSGLALFPIPPQAPPIQRAQTRGTLSGADFQETKNVNTIGANVLPNTKFAPVSIKAVRGPSLNWLLPNTSTCVRGASTDLLVLADSTRAVRSVTFRDGRKRIGLDRTGISGLYSMSWRLANVRKARHIVTATVLDLGGRTYSARQVVRVCK
jgi:hypothetical protein